VITMRRYYSVPQAAREIGVAYSTLYRWIDKSTVEAKVGLNGRLCVTAGEVDRVRALLGRDDSTGADGSDDSR